MELEGVYSDEHGRDAGTRPTNCSCGWTNKARIVGGKETLKNEYPLMAGVMRKVKRSIVCGGTILTQKHVMTAAHCPFQYPGESLTVVIGEHDQLEDVSKSGAEIIDVAKSIIHEKYDDETLHYDIALLVLARSVQFTQLVGPACLPTNNINVINEYVKVLGWGRLQTGGATSPVLLKVNLRVIPLKLCIDNYIRPIEDKNPFQMCTYLRSKDSCQGDSGGPVLWLDPETNRYTVVGVVSYGKRCGHLSPSVNTQVASFLDWIQQKISGKKLFEL
ncbi:hypothetical protein AAG570_001186 [Ranatra chinensis]|uniref:Peptidase S1 domain-containing protein n=1 Tax=Ranatra chinensis TaxID=642074 RepID=A0ABD0YBE7_9HEMI